MTAFNPLNGAFNFLLGQRLRQGYIHVRAGLKVNAVIQVEDGEEHNADYGQRN
ncbi:hypothetical protein D3C72_2526250 [compost metagenome]